MKNNLKSLFDYQRFEKNEHLEKLIGESENRCAKELSDDDLTLVNAAGEAGSDWLRENPGSAATWYGLDNDP